MVTLQVCGMAGLTTKTDQICDLLRAGMLSGRWRGYLPGRARLAAELACSEWMVEEAMRRLAGEQMLVSEGAGRRRRIVLPKGGLRKLDLRVRILLYDRDDLSSIHNVALLDRLHQAGFSANHAVKTLADLGMDARRVAQFVQKTEADAWIVSAGSREVLEWFSAQQVPAIALFGRFTGLPIACASPRVAPAMVISLRRLAALGHRRIVMLAPTERRKPFPALFERLFFEELEALGLPTGPYNLPDWDHNAGGLRSCLDSLFQHTPPTAIICQETRIFVAAQQHLARRGIHAPENVSLISSDWDPLFSWCKPAIAHYRWDYEPIVRQVVRWVQNVARGTNNRRQVLFEGEFVEGGTIGKAAGS
jgi:DNA-binding LacI/PurR family transcriptional regulator